MDITNIPMARVSIHLAVWVQPQDTGLPLPLTNLHELVEHLGESGFGINAVETTHLHQRGNAGLSLHSGQPGRD
jgi:hypothetical protein